jgi:hypothetical protein
LIVRALPSTALLAAVMALGGCVEEQRYVVENRAFALTPDTAPAFTSEQGDELFIVTSPHSFPVSPPSSAQLAALRTRINGTHLPFPRMPWVEDSAIDYTLDFVVQNGDAKRANVLIGLDGRSEFTEYAPTPPNDFHQCEHRVSLAPGERATGSVSALELHEIAVDLATVVNGAPNSNLVVQTISQSGRDERVSPYIPSIIPGLVGIVASITSSAAQSITVELSVRAEDHGDRLAARGEKSWQLPIPARFIPVVPEEE